MKLLALSIFVCGLNPHLGQGTHAPNFSDPQATQIARVMVSADGLVETARPRASRSTSWAQSLEFGAFPLRPVWPQAPRLLVVPARAPSYNTPLPAVPSCFLRNPFGPDAAARKHGGHSLLLRIAAITRGLRRSCMTATTPRGFLPRRVGNQVFTYYNEAQRL